MANGIKRTTGLRVRRRLRTALVYGGFGLLTGASLCVSLLFFGSDDDRMRGGVHTTVQRPRTVCPGESVRLQPDGVHGDVFRWQPAEGLSDANAPDPVAAPKRTTSYTAAVYSKTKTVVSTAERLRVTASGLNGAKKEKIIWRFNADAANGPNLVTLQARTNALLDKAMLQLRVNGKPVADYAAQSTVGAAKETVWDHAGGEAVVTLHLLDYDGDGETIECTRLEWHELQRTDIKAEVRVDKACKGCDAPAEPQVVNVNTREVKLLWRKTASGMLLVRYRDVKESDWRYQTVKGKTALLKDLSPDANYTAQAAALCKADTSAWSPPAVSRAADRKLTTSWTEAHQ